MNSKSTQQKELVHQTSSKPETKTSQKERKNGKMTEKILPQDQKEKFFIPYKELYTDPLKIFNLGLPSRSCSRVVCSDSSLSVLQPKRRRSVLRV